MGVNANFTADFGSFLNAIAAADVALADFGKGAENVELKLNNMVDKWSGRALIQQANELVIAIDKIGGATTLTTTEQGKLNATLNEAIAKYKAIGEEVPPEMQALADQTAKVHKEHTDWIGTLTSLAGAFGIAFSVERLVAWQGQLLANASALNTLSQQTKISIEDLGILTAATASYGVTGDELARALFNLRQRIAGGDQSVVTAYAAMGLSMDEVKAKQNDGLGLLLMTERGLGSLGAAAQDVAAKDLYGGRLGASMIAFSAGADEAVEKAKKLDTIPSTESVKAMADYADAIARVKREIDAWFTASEGKLIVGIGNVKKMVDEGVSKWDLWRTGLQITGSVMAPFLSNTTALGNSLADLNAQVDANTKAQDDNNKTQAAAKPILDAHAQAALFMNTIEKNAVAELEPWQVKYLDHLKEIGQLTTANAMHVVDNVAQLEKYKAGLEASKKAAEDLAKAQAEADKIALDAYTKRIKGLESIAQANLKAYSYEGQIDQINQLIAAEEASARAVYDQLNSAKERGKVIEDLLNREITLENQKAAIQAKQAGVVNAAVIAELDAQTKIAAAYGQNVDGTVKVVDANAKLQKSLDDLHAKKQEGISQYAQEQLLQDQYVKDLKAETDATTGLFTEVGKSVKPVNDMGDAVDNAGKKAGGTKKSVDALTGSIAMATAASKSLADTLDSLFPQGTNGAARDLMYGGYTAGEAAYMASGGILSASIGGGITHRAGGGPVDAGSPYMVGERGPELFVPSSAGNIAPNGAGGLNVVVNVNGSVLGSPDAIARAVGSAFLSVLKAQGTRLPLGAMGSSA